MPAATIKRIEKDFFLQGLYTSRTPIVYFANRTEYFLRIDRPIKHELVLKADRAIPDIQPKQTLDLVFDFIGEIIRFSIKIKTLRYEYITADIPDFLYKNFDRSYLRTKAGSLKIQFIFKESQFSPKTPNDDSGEAGETPKEIDPQSLMNFLNKNAGKILRYASGCTVVVFGKQHPPETIEERLLAGTGKIFYLPSTMDNLPEIDPYPHAKLITRDMLRRHLEGDGIAAKTVDKEIERLIKQKRDNGFLSDAWIPIPAREYIIGYIHIWIKEQGKIPFSYKMLEILYQCAKCFNSGKPKNAPAEGQIIDVSVSGVLFAYPRSRLSVDVVPNGELSVILKTPARTISAAARIARRWQNEAMDYFGCAFLGMKADDMRYLFEYLYGKPPSSEDRDKDKFLTGKV
jgi:hypothetical protein